MYYLISSQLANATADLTDEIKGFCYTKSKIIQ